MEVRVELLTVTLDPRDGRAVLILEHRESGRPFPIWVDDRDAAAIARAAQGRPTSRLDAPGLLLAALDGLGAVVEGAAITGILGGVLLAQVTIVHAGEPLCLDARPSDAVALALRAGAPLVVDEQLLEQVATRLREAEARVLPGPGSSSAETVWQSPGERWNQLLAHLSFQSPGDVYEA